MMDAGRELDVLVAEKVMGWEVRLSQDGDYWATLPRRPVGSGDWYNYPWCPSTDIAAAWEVVEKLGGLSVLEGGADDWFCGFFGYTAFASTAPHAICLAALRAVGEDV